MQVFLTSSSCSEYSSCCSSSSSYCCSSCPSPCYSFSPYSSCWVYVSDSEICKLQSICLAFQEGGVKTSQRGCTSTARNYVGPILWEILALEQDIPDQLVVQEYPKSHECRTYRTDCDSGKFGLLNLLDLSAAFDTTSWNYFWCFRHSLWVV